LPWEFAELTPWEFSHVLYGALLKERDSWQQIGLLGLWFTAPYSKRKRKLSDFVKLPTVTDPDVAHLIPTPKK
jgi:hypothetical protein